MNSQEQLSFTDENPNQQPPHIYVNAGFYLKSRSKDYRGIRSETWAFGKDSHVAIHDLCIGIVVRILEFYFAVGATDDVVDVLGKISASLEKMGAEISESKNKTQQAVQQVEEQR